MKHATIRFRTHEPEYSDLPNAEHNWDASVYGDVEEELPYKAPLPLGKQVILTHYVDGCQLVSQCVDREISHWNPSPYQWNAH
jgi:hypothetical protein